MVTQNYTISTVKNSVPPKVKMSQYDSASRTIVFTVVDASGAEVDLTGKAVTVEGTRIDGHAFVSECTVDEATATFTETVDMTNEAGDHPAELVVRENGQRLGTMNFIISVEPCAMDEDASITEEDKSLFEQLYGVGDAALSAAETLYRHILDNASAPIIYNTASGAVASFSDGADDYPIKGLTVAVEPVQAGSGDPSPSNVRPISGFSEVKVTRAGKNLFPNGTVTLTRYDEFPVYLKAGTYTLSALVTTDATTERCRIGWVNASGAVITTTFVSLNARFSSVVTLTEDCTILRLYAADTANNATGKTATYTDIQIELGSTATDYEPYQGNTYTISLGDTVYGGTLDVVGGKMVVDRAIVDLGYKDWATLGSSYQYGTFWTVSALDNAKYASASPLWMCDRYKAVATNAGTSATGDNYIWIRSSGGNKIVIKDTSKSSMSASEFKAAMSGVPFVYTLETPIEISLTPTQINTLLGNNNVYSDAGDVSVEYPADTKQFILNAIASALA